MPKYYCEDRDFCDKTYYICDGHESALKPSHFYWIFVDSRWEPARFVRDFEDPQNPVFDILGCEYTYNIPLASVGKEIRFCLENA